MPDSLQALIVIVVFILPGFLAVRMDGFVRPIRQRNAFESTGWAVLYSTVVHMVLVIPTSLVCIWIGGLDPTVEDFSWEVWLDAQTSEHLLRTEFAIIVYLATMGICGIALGQFVSTRTRLNVPVWSKETLVRSQTEGPLVCLAIMTNGDQYSGTLFQVPTDYEVLTRKDRDFSIRDAVYVPKDGEMEALDDAEIVLLNSRDIASLHVAPGG